MGSDPACNRTVVYLLHRHLWSGGGGLRWVLDPCPFVDEKMYVLSHQAIVHRLSVRLGVASL
jgi:hypothetical protein